MMVFYKTGKLYKVLYISSLPQIAKLDDTELSMYKLFSSITECASVLNVLLYCISSLPQIAKFVNPGITETVYAQIISLTECVSWITLR